MLKMQSDFRFIFACIFAIFFLGGCKASFDMFPEKPQLQNQSQASYDQKIEELESELQGLKSQNAARIKELENEVESLRNADPETSSSESDLDALKTFVAYGKLYDDDGFRYVDATKDGKALNAVLEWEANGDEGMLVLDKQGLFVEATINVAKEPDSCDALYEGDGDVYETEYKGITFQTFNHLCLKSAGVQLYLHHIEMGAPGRAQASSSPANSYILKAWTMRPCLNISLKQTRAPGLSIPAIDRPLHQRTHRRMDRIPKQAIKPITRSCCVCLNRSFSTRQFSRVAARPMSGHAPSCPAKPPARCPSASAVSRPLPDR